MRLMGGTRFELVRGNASLPCKSSAFANFASHPLDALFFSPSAEGAGIEPVARAEQGSL